MYYTAQCRRFNNYTSIIKPSILNNSFIYVSPQPTREGRGTFGLLGFETKRNFQIEIVARDTITISTYARILTRINSNPPREREYPVTNLLSSYTVRFDDWYNNNWTVNVRDEEFFLFEKKRLLLESFGENVFWKYDCYLFIFFF